MENFGQKNWGGKFWVTKLIVVGVRDVDATKKKEESYFIVCKGKISPLEVVGGQSGFIVLV